MSLRCPDAGCCLSVEAFLCGLCLLWALHHLSTLGLCRSTGQGLCILNKEAVALNSPKPPLRLFSRSVLAGGSLVLGKQTNCMALL